MTVRARCEDCDDLQIITPTGLKHHEERSSQWWRIVSHKDKRTGQFCPGSGKLV